MKTGCCTMCIARLLLAAIAVLSSGGALAQEAALVPRLGKPISLAELARWDTDIFADGRGLPSGSGNAQQGADLYVSQCAACHGVEGSGATADHLTGDLHAFDQEWPDKHVGTYWPYATTLFDFIRRAMPMSAPGSLTADQVYALTAYILHINRIIDATEEMNAVTLPKVIMPNADGFISAHPVTDATGDAGK